MVKNCAPFLNLVPNALKSMVKIRPLEDVLRTHPEFMNKTGWKPIVIDDFAPNTDIFLGLDNPKLGNVKRVVVCEDDGSPKWDQYQITEGPIDEKTKKRKVGGVGVAYVLNERGVNVCLIQNTRGMPKHPDTGRKGIKSLEFPRGFADKNDPNSIGTVLREVMEETGGTPRNPVYLGALNANTSFYETHIDVFAAELTDIRPERMRLDPTEEIDRKVQVVPVDYFKREYIAKQRILCGFTLAAFSYFDAFISVVGDRLHRSESSDSRYAPRPGFDDESGKRRVI